MGSDNEIAFLVGATNVFRNDEVASVYWPGLRDDDSWSMTKRSGSGTKITRSVTNASGLRYGCGLYKNPINKWGAYLFEDRSEHMMIFSS